MITPYSYWFSDGTSGCVMAETKARAIMTILELNPSQRIVDLTLHLEPEWTSNPHCESQTVNTCQIQMN
jgi:metal-sulfur cluster biosynthetic enzyme